GREHHDDPGLAVRGGGLVVARRGGAPDVADGVAVAAGDPDDGRVLLAVLRVRGEVRPYLADRRIKLDLAEQLRRRVRKGPGGRLLADDLRPEALPRLGQGLRLVGRARAGLVRRRAILALAPAAGEEQHSEHGDREVFHGELPFAVGLTIPKPLRGPG